MRFLEIPNNNRPISLLPVLSKLIEKIALNQFNDFLTQQGNLTCNQSGNRKYHSTETLSLLVTGHIFKAMDKKEITAMVLIDLSKAFDSICHRTLPLKLQGLGGSSKASKWFQGYLIDRMQSTMVGHLFQNYDTIYVRFFPTYTCNHSCYTIYVRFLSRILAFYSQVYDHFVTNAYIYAHKKAHIYALQTSMW